MAGKITKKYEARHLANINKAQKRVKDAYEKTIDKIFKQAGAMSFSGGTFNIDNYPVIKVALDAAMKEFHDELTFVVTNAIKDEWELSGDKHAEIISANYKGRHFSDTVNRIIYDKHEAALEAFLNQKIKGLNLSDRVWRYTNQFQSEIEQGLYAGLSEGMSAASMATLQKQYLQQPNKLFRRVRDAKGNLVLSKNAKAYKPGRGIYRSSYKNAFRMTRNQNNFAYRTADHERWKSTPFILGIEIRLSNNHPHYDMCDRLVGKYPATFKFRGFHISCICFPVPILADDEEFDAYENAVLAGTDHEFEFNNKVSEIPADAKAWVKSNEKQIAGWKNPPLFMQDNKIK